MRDGGREQEITGKKRHGSRQWDAVVVDLVEIWKDMVTETRRQGARGWKAGNWWWEETDLAEANANPPTRMDGVGVKS